MSRPTIIRRSKTWPREPQRTSSAGFRVGWRPNAWLTRAGVPARPALIRVDQPAEASPGGRSVRITWFGHAAFLFETAGLRIILDPYRSPDSGGYEPIAEPADLVVVSHENDRYHSHLGQIIPPFETLRALELPPEGRLIRGIQFE